MKKALTFLLLFLVGCNELSAQNYTTAIQGNPSDTITFPERGSCLLGGGQDNLDAFKWFLSKADGGDVLVLTIGNTDNYSDLLFNQSGVQVHSVETIMFQNPSAAFESYIHQKIDSAEAIFLPDAQIGAPVLYWKGTPIDSLIRNAVNSRKVPLLGIGSTMNFLGQNYFTAQNGDILSDQAMLNPYANEMVLSSQAFLWDASTQGLERTILEGKIDNPDLRGRLATFMARLYTDNQFFVTGIGLDEGTAVCIDEFNMAFIFGNSPTSDDNVYFVRENCELQAIGPEVCASGTPLIWKRDQQALSVCHFNAGAEADQTFDLNDWLTSNGGFWEYWYVESGVFGRGPGVQPNCNGTTSLTDSDIIDPALTFFPNPSKDQIMLSVQADNTAVIIDIYGKIILDNLLSGTIDVTNLAAGTYFIHLANDRSFVRKLIISH